MGNAHSDPNAVAIGAQLIAPPLGWRSRYGFTWRFPTPDLPLIPGGRISFGSPELQPNYLYLGDNLQVMRSLPDASIDLITVDPPFFSGHSYTHRDGPHVYSDVWEGGLAEYLAWLNARLYEMKRLLKPDGTLYVHLDYHAAHYVKVELDKLFGYGRMLNEIIWYMNSGQRRAHSFGPRHNIILRYSLSDTPTFNADAVREPYSPDINVPASKAHYYHPNGKVADDVWRIPIVAQNDRRERTGYPTQKPEALLERIIQASSNPGDVVADFFCGSGTALVVAARLGRRWIGCDIAPEAVRVTLARLRKQQGSSMPDVALIYAGMAPLPATAQAEGAADAAFREAAIRAYGGQVRDEGPIHGVKGREALHVAEHPVAEQEAAAFVEALREGGWKRGTVLAVESGPALPDPFGSTQIKTLIPSTPFSQDQENGETVRLPKSQRLRKSSQLPSATRGEGGICASLSKPVSGRGAEGEALTFVKLSVTPGLSGPVLTFALPPRIRLRLRRVGELDYRFDAGDSVSMNPGARILRVEWQVEPQDGGEAHVAPEDGAGWRARCRFSRPGRYAILCRVRDDRGGEGVAGRTLAIGRVSTPGAPPV